ncbi:tetratricopeptide repeat protein [Mucilaginibacter terrenus]|uniref:Tetratricopeptide repeat protein n=1 Tax=Mucilaginibacter terrenus TaxID=2482727 RepID=A0A3E2NJP7_9SPHI|nr:tetratricopeptide repeat protein [Mucilaginibacter terrenus]RFZ81222.1 tetratricopeptide repeat protein [Mucilaginibacter terrenus]
MKSAALLVVLGVCTASIVNGQGRDKLSTAKPMSYADSVKVKYLFFEAIRQKSVENRKDAADIFTQVLAIDPANDASMYELANLEKTQNNYSAAAPLLEKAVAIKPNNEWYWLALADSYEKSNDLPRLQNVFDQLIRINPDKADYYFDKANAFYLQRRYDEALKLYDKVEQITGPSDDLQNSRQKIYLKQGNIEKAASELEKLVTANPTEIKYYLMLAELYNSNGLNDKALAALEKAKKTGISGGLLHMAMADVYRDQKKYQESFNELKLGFADPNIDVDQKVKIILNYVPQFADPVAKSSALTLAKITAETHPSSDKAYAIYGDMLVQNEKYREARPVYKKAQQLNPQSYAVQEQLVRMEMAESDFDAAIKDGEEALSYFPNQAWMNYLVGVAWQQKGNNNKALGYLKNAASLEAQDKELLSQCYSALGDCYHSLKDNKNSDESYEKSLTYNPDNAFTMNNYAYYLSVRNEQLDRAAQLSKRSTELQPNTASFEDTYAWILFKQKRYADAKVWIEKSLQHDNNSATKTEHYGDILFFTGDTAAAVKSWTKAKVQGGTSPLLDKKINEKKYSE